MIRIGNAPCSWGSLEFEGLEGEAIPYGQMLDELAATGYTGTELGDWGFMPTAADRLLPELRSRSLTMLGAFVPVALRYRDRHEAGVDAALRVARLLNAVANEHEPFLVLADDNGTDPLRTGNAGRVTPSMALSDDDFRTFAEGADLVAARVSEETGLRTVFHHHCAGFIETPDEIERLLELTDASLLGLVFDTGHYAFGAGGCEGIPEALDRWSDRIWYVHFKDFDPTVGRSAREKEWDYFEAVRNGVFCELGKGCVDFPGVKHRLEQAGYDGWIVVEQDVLPGMGAPRESAERNRKYLNVIGL